MRRWGLEGVVDEDAAVMVAMFCALLSALSEKKMNKNESQFGIFILHTDEHRALTRTLRRSTLELPSID